VVEPYPFKKNGGVGMMNFSIYGKHVPNHQPYIYIFQFYYTIKKPGGMVIMQ